MCITNPLKISDFQGNLLHMLLFPQKHAFYFSILRIKEGLSHVQQPRQFVKEYSPKSLRNREGFWYNRRKPPREAPSWKSTPKTPAAKQWLLT